MRRFAKILFTVLALLIVGATLLPLLRLEAWWIRIFDFPRGQLLVAGLLILVAYLFVWSPRRLVEALLLGLLLLSLAYQGYRIFPYTSLAEKQVLDAERHPPDSSFSLLIANVLMENRASEELLAIIRRYDPDLVLALEPDAWWEAALRPLEETYPYTLKKPLDNTYGMLLYSRMELLEPEIKFLVEANIPSMHVHVRLPSGVPVWLHFLHPEPPNPSYAKETTERDAELLIIGEHIKERDRPTVVAGDFNDVAWSYTTRLFQEISSLLDPRMGRGTYSTFNAKNPILRWPLDHVFHSEHFKLMRLERGPAFGSDHFPVYAALTLDPEAPWQQEEPDAEPEDKQEAEEKIEEAGQKEKM